MVDGRKQPKAPPPPDRLCIEAGAEPPKVGASAYTMGGARKEEIALRTRPMLFYQKNFDTPTGTIRAYLNIFQRFLQR